MIYTRNKQGFKTKTVKTPSSSTTSNKLSQNGLSLVEELRQRLQNKNKKPQNAGMGQDVTYNITASDRPKSSTPKKLTISKNFTSNQEQMKKTVDNEQSTEDRMKELSLNTHVQQNNVSQIRESNKIETRQNSQPQSLPNNQNPFSKIKKDPFMQLINHQNASTHQSTQINLLGHSRKDQSKTKQHPSDNDRRQSLPNKFQNCSHQGQDLQPYDEVKEIYESPIQGLNKSNYSNKSNTVEAETIISSKKVYENQVKKWGSKTRENSSKLNQNTNSNRVMESGNDKCAKPELVGQRQQQQTGDDSHMSKLKKAPTLSIVSKTINQPIILHSQSRLTSTSSAQQQYLELLQTQISSLKHQLSNCTNQLHQLTYSSSTLSASNQLFIKQNLQLKDSLIKAENKLLELGESSFVIDKYERLFQKMRNLLIINAMEMIENKNFLELNFIPSLNSSINNSPQLPSKHSHLQTSPKPTQKTKHNPFINQQDCHSRIHSINECLAKVEQTIEVSQAVVNINHQRQLQQDLTNNQIGRKLQIKELLETINYKDKIILKLKEEILEAKDKLDLTKSGSRISPAKQHSLYGNAKPYSYVDEIHLLRHQINRLTQQNCLFYEKYSLTKAQLQQKQQKDKIKNFPNHQRITQIQSLIKKLDKTQADQLNNSKLEYWTNNKTNNRKHSSPQQQRHKTNLGASKSKGKPNQSMNHTSKPIQLDFNKSTQVIQTKLPAKPSSIVPSNTQLLPGQQKVIRQTKERYSSERKGEKIEYSREEFSELVKQFKSTLSGLTPEKRQNLSKDHINNNNYPQNKNNQGRKQAKPSTQIDEIIQLPTFRTPKQPKPQQKKQHPLNTSVHQNNQQTQLKPSSEQLIQQHQEQNQSEYIQAISRLEYEKEFLASQRENLIKQNEKLIERIRELEELHRDDNLQLVKEEIYKLKFQNEQLVKRTVQAENQLQTYQNKSFIKNSQPFNQPQTQPTHSHQLQIQSLMQQNIELHKTIQSLQHKNHQLTTLSTDKTSPKTNSYQQQLSYILAPSFEQLFTFLKKLPSDKHRYHQILLNMIQGYQRKVSLLRDENVVLKSRHKELQELFVGWKGVLEKVGKYFATQKTFNGNSLGYQVGNEQTVVKLTAQIRKNLLRMDQINQTYFSQLISPLTPVSSTHSTHSSLISTHQSKINYHLMFLRSLVQGIGQADLQMIESQLNDYLKQLRTRIPTVLEQQQYEESNQSSLNTSVVHEGDQGEMDEQ